MSPTQVQTSAVGTSVGTVDFLFQCCMADPNFAVDRDGAGHWVAQRGSIRCTGDTALEALERLAWGLGFNLSMDMGEFAALCTPYVEALCGVPA